MHSDDPTDEYTREVAHVLGMLGAMASPRLLTADLIETWAGVLWEQDVPQSRLRHTARRLLATDRFFPAPADFLCAWQSLDAEDRLSRQPTPEEEARRAAERQRQAQELLALLPELQAAQAERRERQDRFRHSEWLNRRAAEEALALDDPFGQDAPRC